MLTLEQLCYSRRSIREYTSEKPSKNMIERLLRCAMLAPSSRGIMPWKLVLIDDPVLLAALGQCKQHGAEFVAKAPLAVLVCGEPHRSDVWIEDVALVAGWLHLAAHEHGLGSCWIQLRQRVAAGGESSADYVRRILKLDQSLEPAVLMALGYPDEKLPAYEVEDIDCSRVLHNAGDHAYGFES